MAIFIRNRKRVKKRRLVGAVGKRIGAEIFRDHLCHSILVRNRIHFWKRKAKLRKIKK